MIPDGNDVDSAVAGFAGLYIPLYPSSAKLPSWKIAQCIDLALTSLDHVDDPIPEALLFKNNYPTIRQALEQIHHPNDLDATEIARERLTFDEALLMQLLLLKRKSELKKLDAVARPYKPGGLLDGFDARLPFELTAGQKSVSQEIASDLAASHPMHRLLQGRL
jgi:ATP-dependent DNA helicase RecG